MNGLNIYSHFLFASKGMRQFCHFFSVIISPHFSAVSLAGTERNCDTGKQKCINNWKEADQNQPINSDFSGHG